MVNVFEQLIAKLLAIHKLNNFQPVEVHVEKPNALVLNIMNLNDTIHIFTTGLVTPSTMVLIFYQTVHQSVNVDVNVVMDIVAITKENVSEPTNVSCRHVRQTNFDNVSTLHVTMLFVKFFLVTINVLQQKYMVPVKENVFVCLAMLGMIKENVFSRVSA